MDRANIKEEDPDTYDLSEIAAWNLSQTHIQLGTPMPGDATTKNGTYSDIKESVMKAPVTHSEIVDQFEMVAAPTTKEASIDDEVSDLELPMTQSVILDQFEVVVDDWDVKIDLKDIPLWPGSPHEHEDAASELNNYSDNDSSDDDSEHSVVIGDSPLEESSDDSSDSDAPNPPKQTKHPRSNQRPKFVSSYQPVKRTEAQLRRKAILDEMRAKIREQSRKRRASYTFEIHQMGAVAISQIPERSPSPPARRVRRRL